jgi:hypothetical protein
MLPLFRIQGKRTNSFMHSALLMLVRKVTDQTIYHIIDIFYHNFSHNTRIIFLWYHYKRYGMFYFVLSLVLAFLLSIGQLDVAYGTVALVAILEAFS